MTGWIFLSALENIEVDFSMPSFQFFLQKSKTTVFFIIRNLKNHLLGRSVTGVL